MEVKEAKRVCDFAEDKGVLVVPHCWKLRNCCVCTFISYNNLMSIEFLPSELAESQLRKDLVINELPVNDGKIYLPELPGLGIELMKIILKNI